MGFEHAFEKHLNEVDWFLKSDDDTYVIVENLKLMLADFNTSEPMWFGCKFHPYVKVGSNPLTCSYKLWITFAVYLLGQPDLLKTVLKQRNEPVIFRHLFMFSAMF